MVNVNCAVKIPVGVLSACQNGIYIGQDVQALACEKGWRYSEQFQMVMKDDDTEDAETYIWAWDEAEQFLMIKWLKRIITLVHNQWQVVVVGAIGKY